MWLYYLLKTISTLVSWLPYKLVVNIGIGIGHLYHTIAKKQRDEIFGRAGRPAGADEK